MKNIVVLLFLSLSLFFSGCGCEDQKSHEIDRLEIGKIIDAGLISTSFNEYRKTQIKTDKVFIIIYGNPIVPFGVEAHLSLRSDGRTYFTWKGSHYLYVISQ